MVKIGIITGSTRDSRVNIQVAEWVNLSTDFENMSVFKPASHHQETVDKMLDEVVSWSTALKTIRD